MGAAQHQPFLSSAVPTCSLLEPRPPAWAAIKSLSVLFLGGFELVAKGLRPYPHVLAALLWLDIYIYVYIYIFILYIYIYIYIFIHISIYMHVIPTHKYIYIYLYM